MMVRAFRGILVLTVVLGLSTSCVNFNLFPGDSDSATVSNVAVKAVDVAENIGVANGYGGTLMSGYIDHMPVSMGFDSEVDLAPSTSTMTVSFDNLADTDCTYHLNYFANHMGIDDLVMDVDVSAGDNVSIIMPCAEIIGLGPFSEPGQDGCHLADGQAIANTMSVPGFLGQDYVCGGVYEFTLTTDADDLDGDGDREELILLSDAMELHMMDGGPMGHNHGTGLGMMGPHMGFSVTMP